MRSYGSKQVSKKHNDVMESVKLLMAEQGNEDIAAIEARFNEQIDKLAAEGGVWRPKQ